MKREVKMRSGGMAMGKKQSVQATESEIDQDQLEAFVERVNARKAKQAEYRQRPEVKSRMKAKRQERADREKAMLQKAKDLGLL
jgi:hypothetical protein